MESATTTTTQNEPTMTYGEVENDRSIGEHLDLPNAEVKNEVNVTAVVPVELPSPAQKKSGRGRQKKKQEKHKPQTPRPIQDQDEPLSVDDVRCPTCLCIFIEPVTFPCSHSLCQECCTETFQKTSYQCPVCRFRLSNWSRIASKTKSYVNIKFWERIKREFPEKVQHRIDGIDDDDLDPSSTNFIDFQVCETGTINEEYKNFQKQHEEELEEARKIEEEKSLALIKQLQDNLEIVTEVQTSELEKDEEFARQLQKQFDKEAKQVLYAATPVTTRRRAATHTTTTANKKNLSPASATATGTSRSPTLIQTKLPFKKVAPSATVTSASETAVNGTEPSSVQLPKRMRLDTAASTSDPK